MQQKRVALQEKETQAELKAEQSRIAIMDDGYEEKPSWISNTNRRLRILTERTERTGKDKEKQLGKAD